MAVLPDRRLNADLSAHASVDAGSLDAEEVAVVDVDSAEANKGVARVGVVPVVVGESHVELALVLAGVAVGVANETGLVVVVEEGVGHGDPVGAVGDVEQTVVVVLAGRHVGREVAVVNPDVGGGLNANGIAIVGLDLLDGQVANNDVLDVLDVETDADQLGAGSTNNRLVGLDADLGAARDGALDVDVELAAGLGGLGELG